MFESVAFATGEQTERLPDTNRNRLFDTVNHYLHRTHINIVINIVINIIIIRMGLRKLVFIILLFMMKMRRPACQSASRNVNCAVVASSVLHDD